jgi:hypothetical protein
MPNRGAIRASDLWRRFACFAPASSELLNLAHVACVTMACIRDTGYWSSAM